MAATKKINGVLAPHYEVLLGGGVDEDKVTFGTSVIKIPSKNAPQATRLLIDTYKNEKNENESFGAFFNRKGKDFFRELLYSLRDLPDIEKDPQAYIDFGAEKKFSLEDRGQGECAGAVTDMITDRLSESERAHFQSKLSLEKDAYAEAIEHAKRSTVSSARALLVTEGMDFNDDLECIRKFHSLIIDMEIVSAKFALMAGHFEKDTAENDKETASWWVQNSGELSEECRKVNDKMQSDKSLRIRTGGEKKGPAPAAHSRRSIYSESSAPSTTSKQNLSWKPWLRAILLKFCWTRVSPSKMFPGVSRMMATKSYPWAKKTDISKMVIEKA